MDKFSVLPTDERFLSLYEEQKICLFNGICSLANNEDIKISVQRQERIEEMKSRPLESFASKGLLLSMRTTYKAAGMDNNQIEIEVNNYLKTLKMKEVQELEKAHGR